MKFSKNWMGKGVLLLLLLMVACANPHAEPLPTHTPINSVKDDETVDQNGADNTTEDTPEQSSDGDSDEVVSETETAEE